jgi:hypothetical protein
MLTSIPCAALLLLMRKPKTPAPAGDGPAHAAMD